MSAVTSGPIVITDSTADLPADLVAKYGLTVVPLHVVVDGQVYDEGLDIAPDAVLSALAGGRSVTTSQPTPAAFEAAYRAAVDTGARSAVSVHISSAMSGTLTAARLGAASVPELDVRVVDSLTTAMGLGFAALAAAEAAAADEPVDTVAAIAARAAAQSHIVIYAHTLEYLRRGGRIGTAAHLIGSALAMKPLLHVEDGQVAPLAKVRTAGKARSRLLDLAVQAAGDGPVDIAVEHLGAPDVADEVASALRARLPQLRTLHLGPIGAVIAAHVGPGALLVVVAPS